MANNSEQSKTAGGFRSIYDESEQEESKFLAKAKENPFVPAGIIGGLGALFYSAYKFKTRKEKLSLYLIHTRVAAQGAVVSALTIGVVIQMYREYVLGEKPSGLRQISSTEAQGSSSSR